MSRAGCQDCVMPARNVDDIRENLPTWVGWNGCGGSVVLRGGCRRWLALAAVAAAVAGGSPREVSWKYCWAGPCPRELSNEEALLVVVAFDDEDCVLKRLSRCEDVTSLKEYFSMHQPANNR